MVCSGLIIDDVVSGIFRLSTTKAIGSLVLAVDSFPVSDVFMKRKRKKISKDCTESAIRGVKQTHF